MCVSAREGDPAFHGQGGSSPSISVLAFQVHGSLGSLPQPTAAVFFTLHGAGPLKLKGRSSDRKSTRLNSSHTVISYAVFCLKKKKKTTKKKDTYKKYIIDKHK